MKKIRNFVVWTLVFFGLLLAFDLLLVRSADVPPWLQGVQRFYVDFRGRILNLTTAAAPVSIDRVIETVAKPATKKGPGVLPVPPQRYLYADDQGTLHFADSLAEVPVVYRAAAQPLKE